MNNSKCKAVQILAIFFIVIAVLNQTTEASRTTKDPNPKESFLHRLRRSYPIQYLSDLKGKNLEKQAMSLILASFSKTSSGEKKKFNRCIFHYQSKYESTDMLKAFKHCFDLHFPASR